MDKNKRESRIRGILTPKQREYVGEKRTHYTSDERRQWDYRIRESAKKALKDLAFLAEKLPESQQKEVFTVENILPLIGAIISFRAQKAYPLQVMWEQRRRFHLAVQLRHLATKLVEEFNKVFVGDVGVALTPWLVQWYKDGVIFSFGKKPFGEGIAPLALFKPGEPLRYAEAKKSFKPGDSITKNGIKFTPWKKTDKPEPIQVLQYRKAQGAPKIFSGEKAKIFWCNKHEERVFLGTCENCEYGDMQKCVFREPLKRAHGV